MSNLPIILNCSFYINKSINQQIREGKLGALTIDIYIYSLSYSNLIPMVYHGQFFRGSKYHMTPVIISITIDT